jgi:apolipoprotein N-acyltransferase
LEAELLEVTFWIITLTLSTAVFVVVNVNVSPSTFAVVLSPLVMLIPSELAVLPSLRVIVVCGVCGVMTVRVPETYVIGA